MPTQGRQPFSPKGDFVAGVRGLRFAGRTYAPGAEFPSRKLAVPQRRLRQLYERRLLEYAEGFNVDKVHEDATPDDIEDPKKDKEIFTFDPSIHSVTDELEVVDEEGEVLIVIDKKLAKRLMKAKKPVEIELEE